MPIGQLEAETEAHAGKYACKPSTKVFFLFLFLKNGYLFIYWQHCSLWNLNSPNRDLTVPL